MTTRAIALLALAVFSGAANAQTVPPPPPGYRLGTLRFDAPGAHQELVWASKPKDCDRQSSGFVLLNGRWQAASGGVTCR